MTTKKLQSNVDHCSFTLLKLGNVLAYGAKLNKRGIMMEYLVLLPGPKQAIRAGNNPWANTEHAKSAFLTANVAMYSPALRRGWVRSKYTVENGSVEVGRLRGTAGISGFRV